MDVGPKLDVVGELSKAFRENHPSIRFGLYYSLFEFYNPMYLSDKRRNFTKTINFVYLFLDVNKICLVFKKK